MPIGAQVTEFVSKIPQWGKWLAGITALAGVISAVLQDPRPVLILLAVVLLIGALYALWLVATRTQPSSLGGPPVHEYSPSARQIAKAGIGAIVLLVVAGAAVPQIREAVLYSFIPRPLYADVVVAPFRATGPDAEMQVADRIEEAIEARLDSAGMSEVRVIVDTAVVESDEEAQQVIRSRRAKVVIWGRFDAYGIKMSLELSPADSLDAPDVDEIPFSSASSDSITIGVVRDDIVPAAAFLSLFVLGHLHYERNEYRRGLAAFDAAMRALPPASPISNRALVHFFQARGKEAVLADTTGLESPAAVSLMCDYAEAIRLDPDYPDPYNNLGVFLARTLAIESFGEDIGSMVQSSTARSCIEAAGHADDPLGVLFQRARELRPESAVFAYNALAFRWMRSGEIYSLQKGRVLVRADPFIPELQRLIRSDSTLPGPHLLLGVLRFDQGNAEEAVRRFSSAARLMEDYRIQVNLAQALLRTGRIKEAREQFEAALAANAEDTEARLGLAKLDIRAGRLEAARKAIEPLVGVSAFDVTTDEAIPDYVRYAQQDAAVLQSQTHFAEGNYREAQAVLQRWLASQARKCEEGEPVPCMHIYSVELEYLLIAALSRLTGDATARDSVLSHFSPDRMRGALEWLRVVNAPGRPVDEFLANRSAIVTWLDLLGRCAGSETKPRPVTAWSGTKDCLPTPPVEHVQAIYDRFHAWLDQRLYQRRLLAMFGLACPVLFTFDVDREQWVWEGTILTRFEGESRKALDQSRLNHFDGRLRIREVEPEISYLDYVRAVVRSARGEVRSIVADHPALRAADGKYLSLVQGEEVLLHFEGLLPLSAGEEIWIEAEGFYDPIRRLSPRDASVLRASLLRGE